MRRPSSCSPSDESLLDALTSSVICLDSDLRVLTLNAAGEQLLSIGSKRAMGRRLTRLARIPDSLATGLREALFNDRPYTDRQIQIQPHGHDPLLVDCSVALLEPQANRPTCLVLELTAVERPLRIARDEAMHAQQEHARSLLRGLAHEIKNPLGGLRGAAQLLERQLGGEELTEYTSIIIREADRLQNLIDRMLGPVGRPRQDSVNLHEVLEHVRAIATVGAPAGVGLHIDYDPSIPECLSDRDRLVQVLLNIVGNALNAVGDQGSITFRSRVHGNYTIAGIRHRLVAALAVLDDGPGVPANIADQIFLPMVTGTDHGTGLGLSIAQSTMNQLGGVIECDRKSGRTEFTVLLPLEIRR